MWNTSNHVKEIRKGDVIGEFRPERNMVKRLISPEIKSREEVFFLANAVPLLTTPVPSQGVRRNSQTTTGIRTSVSSTVYAKDSSVKCLSMTVKGTTAVPV